MCVFDFFLGTVAYDKLQSILMGKSTLNDIKKLSPDAQTSSLEGFHSTLNQWHPKMICFSWLGTYCRYWLVKFIKDTAADFLAHDCNISLGFK